MLPTDDVVKVLSSVNPTFASTEGFDLLVVVGPSTRLPTGERLRRYAALSDVGVDFQQTDPEYLAATVFFSQPLNSDNLFIARRFAAATAGELLGSTAADKNLAHYTAIANGSLTLSVDGVVEHLTGLDLTAAANLNAVAAVVQAALVAVPLAGSTVTWTGSRFIVRSGTTGAASAVGFSTAAPTGTDLGTLMGLTQVAGAVSTPGVIAEASLTATLDAIEAGPVGLPYGITLTAEATKQNLEDAAAWCQANKHLFAYTTSDGNALNAADQTNVGYLFKQEQLGYVFGMYDPVNPYSVISIVALMFSVDFSQPNSVQVANLKTLPGVLPATLTATQIATLKSFNLNYYVSLGGRPVFRDGRMADGGWFDVRQNLDWLDSLVQTSAFDYLAGVATKVPQTDAGVARVVQVLDVDLEVAVTNGTLAPGIWRGAPIPGVKTGQTLPKGYFIYAPSVDDQLEADRTARTGPALTVLACGAGAIQGLNIQLTYQQ